MEKEQKDAMVASIEKVQAIEDFFNQWWGSADLYETAAKATSLLMFMMRQNALSKDDFKDLTDFLEQHLMMIDLIKPFEKKGGDHE